MANSQAPGAEDRFEAARPRANSRPNFKRVAALTLSALGVLGGGASTASAAASAFPIETELQMVEDVAPQVTLDQLKGEIREVFGRAPRTRAETFRRLDSLELKGILHREYSPTGRTILSELSQLTRQDLARGVHRRNLIRDVVRHLDNPELMKQGERDTCAAAGLQHLLASRDPTQYVHLARGLVSAEGTVITRQGQTLERVEHSIDDDSGRSEVSSVMQSAIMDYANGPEIYSNRQDLSTGTHAPHLHEANPFIAGSGHRDGGHPGLFPGEITRGLSALFGTAETVFVAPDEQMGRRSDMNRILQDDGVIVAGVRWDQGTHLLVIKEVSSDGVVAWNPWGESGRSQRVEAPASFDRFGSGMTPLMMSQDESHNRPDYEVLSATGLIKFSTEEFFSRLQSFEAASRVGD